MKNKSFITFISAAVLSTLILTGCGVVDNIPEENIPVPAAVEQPAAEENTPAENTDAPLENIEITDSDNNEIEKNIEEPDNIQETNETADDNNTEKVKNEISLVDERIADVESQEQEQNKKLEREDITQSEMNQIASAIYRMWDDQLNWMWGEMVNKLDTDTITALTAEQNQWIERRDAQIKEAGAEAEGGSMQPLLEASKGTQMTKDRVNELAQWLR